MSVVCILLFPEADTQPRFAQPIGNQEVVASRNVALKCVVENLGNYQVSTEQCRRPYLPVIATCNNSRTFVFVASVDSS